MMPLLLAFAAAVSPGPLAVRDETLELEYGTELRYAISEPRNADGGKRPLVVALHFGWSGDLPPGYGRNYLSLLVAPALAELDAIVVAPDAIERSWTHPRSETAVLALVEHVRATRAVDSDRIVLTGFSLGAMGTWFLASRHPDLWSAAIPMAGPPILHSVAEARAGLTESRRLLDQAEIEWPPALVEMPLFAIHSRADELVDIELVTGAVESLRAAAGRVELMEIEGLGHFETARYVRYLARAVPWLRDVWAR